MRAVIFICVLGILIMVRPGAGFAQCNDDQWTNDAQLRASAEAQTKIYKSAIQSGSLKQAAKAITWLVQHAPKASSDVYIQGVEVFDDLAEQEKDEKRSQVYVDSMLLLYDLQMKYCGAQSDIFNAKAMSYYKFKSSRDPSAALKFFDSLLRVRGNDVSNETVIAYMETVKKAFRKFHNLKDDQIIEHYNRAMRIAEFKQRDAAAKGISDEKYLLLKDDIDALLFSMVVINCNFVKKNLGPRFRQHPDDLTLARKILSFMLQNQCIDDPLWLEAGEKIYHNTSQKDFSLAKSLGLRYFAIGKTSKAQTFLTDALDRAPGNRDKSEILVYLGRLQSRTDKPAARKMYLEALELDRDNKESYERIGDLYYESAHDCSSKTNPVDAQLVYMLAFEYYQRSGNDKKVGMAKEKFPTKAELAAAGYSNGTEKVVDCWIQETTTFRTKD